MDYALFIDGQMVKTQETVPVRLPYDGSVVATVAQAGPAEVDAAVEAASRAARVMREMSRGERAAILRRAQDLLAARKQQMGEAISSECGKPIREALGEVDRGLQTLMFSAEEAHRLAGEEIPLDAATLGKGRMGMTIREPLGVIAAITPFNFPLNLSLHKIGPAIAAGNAVVHKPASSTPLSGLLMANIFHDAGLPPGALNVIPGPGGKIGDQLVFHPAVSMITFTGSAEVGVRLRNLAGLKRVTLELGNNSAVIIENDARLDEAVPACVRGSFSHSGQVCISVQRIFVHEGVRAEFVEMFREQTERLRIGHPQDPATDVSSLITEHEAQRVEEWIGEARDAGAQVVTGGERHNATVTPAVLTQVPAGVRLWAREAFGPVVGINGYESLDEAIGRVNASDYGLQAGIFTRDIEKAFRTARAAHVGGFMINDVPQFRVDQMPYGGVKQSGTGREGPKYAIEEMTESKLITWRT